MCDLWKKSLGSGKVLPSDYAFFLRYREENKPKVKAKPKPKADAEEKPKEGEKPEGDEKPKEDG